MGENVKSSNVMAILSLIFGIIGLLTTCLVIGVVFCVVGLILGIIVLSKHKPGKGMAIAGTITSILGIIFFIVLMTNIVKTTDSSVVNEIQSNQPVVEETASEEILQTEKSTAVEETTTAEETTTTQETTTASETTESADSFKASCQEIGYKTLLRTPDDYVGQRIVITAKVQQVMDGGWLSDNKYYRMQTDNDGYGFYFDDEYFMYDFRPDDTTKLLKDDVLKVYAEFAGLEEVKRALTSTKEEIPAIKAYYVELISE